MAVHSGAAEPAPEPDDSYAAWTLGNGAPWAHFYRTPSGGYLLRFTDLADFRIGSDGRDVECFPGPRGTAEAVDHLFHNQVLPLCLSHRGALVFHGSAVEIDGAAVAFIARSGRGKSTLAASFSGAGHKFMTDDALVLERDGSGYKVVPTRPSIRLWKDSATATLPRGFTPAPALPYTAKQRHETSDAARFSRHSLPLSAAYFLGGTEPDSPTIEMLEPAEACIAWVSNSFVLDRGRTDLLSNQFEEVCQRLAIAGLAFGLEYRRHFAQLDLLRSRILEHLRNRD